MKHSEKERLKNIHKELLGAGGPRPLDILPTLRQEGIFDEDDEERVLAEKTTRDKMMTLLNLLPLRGPRAYSAFRSALKDDYDWIVDKLDNVSVDASGGLEAVGGADGTQHSVARGGKKCEPTIGIEVNHKLLMKVANHPEVLRGWKGLARCLGLEEPDIIEIEYANQFAVKEQSYQALIKWQSRKGKRVATAAALITGLRECGFTHLADELENS